MSIKGSSCSLMYQTASQCGQTFYQVVFQFSFFHAIKIFSWILMYSTLKFNLKMSWNRQEHKILEIFECVRLQKRFDPIVSHAGDAHSSKWECVRRSWFPKKDDCYFNFASWCGWNVSHFTPFFFICAPMLLFFRFVCLCLPHHAPCKYFGGLTLHLNIYKNFILHL